MKIKDKTKNALMCVIEEALSRSDLCTEVFFATERGPCEAADVETENGINDYFDVGVTFILSGGQNTFFYRDGKRSHTVAVPGLIFVRGKGSYDDLDWQLPCKRLGLAFRNNWLGMAWKFNRKSEKGQVETDLWFSTEHLERYPDMKFLFKALEMRSGCPGDSPVTCQLPRMILERMLEILAEDELLQESSSQATCRRIRRYLEGNLHLPINRKTVANLFRLNPDYVTRLFKTCMGMGFCEYLTLLRLEMAEEMLRRSGFTVKEVAGRCGFAEVSYFIKVFRKKYGVSPGEFKSPGE